MFERGYRQRLEADLIKWVGDGVISGDTAQSIRTARFGEEAASRLPAIFAMLGALMLAASVSAFVAANWQEIPRLVRLAGILALIAACFPLAMQLGRRAMPWGDDAAVTFATLCFGAGVALVGQMYHLPGDWPAMLVAIGAVIAAALTGKSGPLVIGFVAMTAWSFGRFDDWQWRDIHWPFLLLFVPAFALALGRENRLLAHTAILALSVWLATLLAAYIPDRDGIGVIDGGLAISAAYMAIGLLAWEKDWPSEFRALLPWGAWMFGALLCAETVRALENPQAHFFDAGVGMADGAALAALASLGVLARDKGRLALIAACAIGLTIPLMFVGLGEAPSRVLVPVAVLVSAVTLVAGGLVAGLRSLVIVGYAVFGVSILILLWRTIGTLLGQSLFFLVAGAVLLGLAFGARRLAGWSRRMDRPSTGEAA